MLVVKIVICVDKQISDNDIYNYFINVDSTTFMVNFPGKIIAGGNDIYYESFLKEYKSIIDNYKITNLYIYMLND